MAQNGAKEISLIAQDTTSYGQDLYGKPQLVPLLEKLLKNRAIKRLRIMYGYPHRVTDELARLIASTPRIFHYIDIPLQHIADPFEELYLQLLMTHSFFLLQLQPDCQIMLLLFYFYGENAMQGP